MLSYFTKEIRIRDKSTVWVRPDQIEMIVKRNCPGDRSIAEQLLDDCREDVWHEVSFSWHTKYTGWFYITVNNVKLQLYDHEVIRCEL